MKSLLIVVAMLVVALMSAPAMAGGSASVQSGVQGMVLSGNVTANGFGGSYASQTSVNQTTAGFGTCKQGNTVTATTFGNSTGYTSGIAINGIAAGLQGGAFSATATKNTGRR